MALLRPLLAAAAVDYSRAVDLLYVYLVVCPVGVTMGWMGPHYFSLVFSPSRACVKRML